MKDLPLAVGFAAKLKPEIRLAQAISEFNASLSNNNQRTRFKNLQSKSPPTPVDIIRLTEEINRDGAKAHRSWRPYGTRLVAILERMRQFAPVGDVLVGGSQNLIACGVWAVVRLSLETSLSFLSYFENVTSMMLRLGRSLSLHKDFAMLFPRCSTLQSYMCEYTIVMVNICAKIVHNCARSALSQLAASFTSTFDAIFKPLESDLTAWAQLIEKRATVLLAKDNLQSQSSVLDRFNRLQVTMSRESATQQKETRKHRLLTALCPNQGEFDLIWRRERKRGTSSWMYEQDTYKSWLSSKVESVLWLKGNLGSGKTVTMASVVAHLTLAAPSMDPQGDVTVSYFFCQTNNPKTLSASALLGSIAGQVLQNPALGPSLMSFLEQLETVLNTCAMPEEYIDILLKATPPNWRGIFVLDGLDEMPEEEVDDIFGQLHRLGQHRWVSLLCSSRPTSACYTIARSNMNEVWTLSMETADRSEEIRAYLEAEISRWSTIRPLSTELKWLVEEQLVAGCQGMLLWLSLQIQDICPRYTQELRSDAEILDILGNLPNDLPGAFDKALSRVRDGKYGNKLFQLVASAEPPLNMDELRIASNVEPGNTRWDRSTLSSSGKTLLSAYGGSLLDVDEEDLSVRFIHYSVLLHLTTASSGAKTHAFHFDLKEAERTLGSVCVTYLNYSVFENRVSTAQKASFGQVPQAMARSVMPSEVFRKGLDLLSKYRRRRETKVDLERLSYELQNERRRVRDDVHLFLDYAKHRWLLSTRHIWSDDRHGILPLLRDLITKPIVSASLPWDPISDATAWALANGHGTLFQSYLHSDEQYHLEEALSTAIKVTSKNLSVIRLRGKGLGWLAPLYLVQPRFEAPVFQAFINLDCVPFNPAREEPPSLNLTESAVTTRAEAHLVAALNSDSPSPDSEKYVLFLATYLRDLDLVLDDKSSILHLAIARGFVSLAFELLSKGADPNGGRAKGQASPLQISIRKGLVELALALVNMGADVTANPDNEGPPLFLSIEISSLELIRTLLARAPVEFAEGYGLERENACHYLCRITTRPDDWFKQEEVLKVLLLHGVDINCRNATGETPLNLALKKQKKWIAEALLEHGADPNIGDYQGIRPLHMTLDVAMMNKLLHRGADPNVAMVHGCVTPLMVAALQGHANAVKVLFRGGANPTLSLSAHVTEEEAMLCGLGPNAAAELPAGATAIELCLWRLEGSMEFLNNEPDNQGLAILCYDLAGVFIEDGFRSQLQHPDVLSRLLDLLSRLRDVLMRSRSWDVLPAILRQDVLRLILK